MLKLPPLLGAASPRRASPVIGIRSGLANGWAGILSARRPTGLLGTSTGFPRGFHARRGTTAADRRPWSFPPPRKLPMTCDLLPRQVEEAPRFSPVISAGASLTTFFCLAVTSTQLAGGRSVASREPAGARMPTLRVRLPGKKGQFEISGRLVADHLSHRSLALRRADDGAVACSLCV